MTFEHAQQEAPVIREGYSRQWYVCIKCDVPQFLDFRQGTRVSILGNACTHKFHDLQAVGKIEKANLNREEDDGT